MERVKVRMLKATQISPSRIAHVGAVIECSPSMAAMLFDQGRAEVVLEQDMERKVVGPKELK